MLKTLVFTLAAIFVFGSSALFAKQKVLDSHYTKAWGDSGLHGWENSAKSLAETVAKNNVRKACEQTYSDGTEVVRYAQDWGVVNTKCENISNQYKCKVLARAICYHYE